MGSYTADVGQRQDGLCPQICLLSTPLPASEGWVFELAADRDFMKN